MGGGKKRRCEVLLTRKVIFAIYGHCIVVALSSTYHAIIYLFSYDLPNVRGIAHGLRLSKRNEMMKYACVKMTRLEVTLW